MKRGWAALGLLAAALLVMLWVTWDAPWMRRIVHAVQPAQVGALPATTLRKCSRGSEVLYTDGPCPEGSREAAVRGQLSVVPGSPPPAAAAASAASAPRHVRDLLVPPGSEDIKARRMDAIIGR